MKICPASSSCSIRPAGRSAGPRIGRAATCRRRIKERFCVRPASRFSISSGRREFPTRCSAICSTRCNEFNGSHLAARSDNSNLAARIASYELAYAMQRHAPEAVDIAQETAATQDLYGLNDTKTHEFGRRCLLARRLVERGVRFVQLYGGGAHNDQNWDAHGDLVHNHSYHAGRTDKPIAGLAQGSEAARLARRNADHLGRRIRPAADGGIRLGHGPRSQCLWLHDVDGRRRNQRRRQLRRDG